jgi:Glycosyl hydrolase family 67 N-terminus.
MKHPLLYLICILTGIHIHAQQFVALKMEAGSFPISTEQCSIMVDDHDDWIVQRAAELLQQDILAVTGKKQLISHQIENSPNYRIIIGTVEHSRIISELSSQHKIQIIDLKGQWEAFSIQVIEHPFKGITKALVIIGSDRRGAAYGVFELSRQMGVSPWYWWADVPVRKHSIVFVKKGSYSFHSPTVKYRGIFINDEAPAFSGWAKEKYGGINSNVYAKIFELLLRLKANYLWPAMWGNAFYDDDKQSGELASKYGIVMGTSHHEPMLRAQQEWKRYGSGLWNYDSNAKTLQQFWRKGIERMDDRESIVTIGMRGDGDLPMTEGTAISLLERIVSDQRKIIADVTGKPPSATPQLWALYKEVQDYYDKGMRVPDDVTLLLCDDNWGNIRRLPSLTEKPRSGGYGIYYHFDYVGGPRNYKWINTNNIARVWEQMHLAYEHRVKNIWIVNVGDLKPMEFPISFFLDYAWNTNRWNETNLRTYYSNWATEQFGSNYSNEIAELLRKYGQYSSRRKPELLDWSTYSLTNYNEFGRVVNEWDDLLNKAEKIQKLLSSQYQDAYFELVLHPIKAMDNLHHLYLSVALNRFYAEKKNIRANKYAEDTKQYYLEDSLLSIQYNKQISNGKWSHMMDQTHIGYTYWQQPPVNKMPAVFYVSDQSNDKVASDSKKNGDYVSIEATHFTRKTESEGIHWHIIPDIGRDGSGITSFPVTVSNKKLDSKSPHLSYDVNINDTGILTVYAYFSPTLNIYNNEGLMYGISFDNEKPFMVSINKDDSKLSSWEKFVSNNIIIKSTLHHVVKTGKHVLNYWMASNAVVLQKLVVNEGGLQMSYLGPPEKK